MTAALRVMGLSGERHFTNYHRVLNRATWSARQASRILLGLLVACLVPPGAPIVLGADDTVERRSGRQITAKGGYRDAVRSTKKHVIHCFGLKWVSMMLLVTVPWARRVWALPFLTALCWPAQKSGRQRHKTSVDWVRQMMQQVRRWLPGRQLVLVVDGGFAAVSLALACVRQPSGHGLALALGCGAVSSARAPAPRQAWPQTPEGDASTAACRPGRSAPTRPGRLWKWTGTAASANSCGSSRTRPCGTPRACPLSRSAMCWWRDPEGKLRMEAFFCTDLQATPVQILQWVVMRWSVEVTFEEGRAHLGLETQRQWSDQAIARTTPVLLALFSLVTLLALQLSQGGQIPVPVTAWYHKAEPTFADCLALVRRHLWRAQYLVNSTAEPEFMQFPREALRALAHWPSLSGLIGQSRVLPSPWIHGRYR